MATKYVNSEIGHDTYGLGTEQFPYNTIAKAILMSGYNDSIILQEGRFNESFTTYSTLYVIGSGNTPPLLDGSGMSNYGLYIRYNGISYLKFENWSSPAIMVKVRLNYISKCIFANNVSAFFFNNYDIREFNNNLLYRNTSFNYANAYLSFNNNTSNSKHYNTFYKEKNIYYKDASCGNSLGKNIYADSQLKIYTGETTSERHSLFYGKCYLWTGSAYTLITSLSQLQGLGYGSFDNCKVLPNIAATVSDNGSGYLRVTKSSHGLLNGEYITIRTADIDRYLSARVQIKYISASQFDILTISFMIGAINIEYNKPLFINEFADIFHVWADSIACEMNDTDPFKSIGWGSKAFSYSIDNFGTNTNITLTQNTGYKDAKKTLGTSNGTLDDGAIIIFSTPISFNQIDLGQVFDYYNGEVICTTPQLSETTFAELVPLDAGDYIVEVGAITIATETYNVGETVLGVVALSTFTTASSGILRKYNKSAKEYDIKLQVKVGATWSAEIKVIYGGEDVELFNFSGNDPATKYVTYGNGDASFDPLNKFQLFGVTAIRFHEITLQDGSRMSLG